MEQEIVYHVLGIDKTNDEGKIREAYLGLLKKYNPEDNPEEFKRLRMAYEEALRLARKGASVGTSGADSGGENGQNAGDSNLMGEDADGQISSSANSEVNLWLGRIDKVYRTIKGRSSVPMWKKLLSDPVCVDLDTSLEAREKLIEYLMNHIYFPQAIWLLLDKVTMITSDVEALKQQYPLNFLDYAIFYTKNEEFISFEIFKARKKNYNIDGYIRTYLNLRTKVNEEADKVTADDFKELTAFGLFHPYETVEKMKVLQARGKTKAALELADKLLSGYPDEGYVLTCIANVKWEAGENEKRVPADVAGHGGEVDQCEEAYKIWCGLLEKTPSHYSAQIGLVKYYIRKRRHAEAREILEELLNKDDRSPELIRLLKECNTALIAEYRRKKKLTHAELIEMCWCLFQNERSSDAIKILKKIKPNAEDEYSYVNLLGRILYTTGEYKEALVYLKRWLVIIRSTKDDGTEENARRLSRISMAYSMIGGCFFELNQGDKAEKFVLRAIELASSEHEKIELRHYYAHILFSKGQYEKSIDVCEEILEKNPQDYISYAQHQESSFAAQRLQDVYDDFYKMLDIYDVFERQYVLLIRAFCDNEMYEDADTILKMAKDKKIKFSEWLQVLDLEVRESKEKGTAERSQLLADLLNFSEKFTGEDMPENEIEALEYDVIILYLKLGEIEKALNDLQLLMQKYPNNMLFQYQYGNVMLNNQDYGKALEAYKKCIANGHDSVHVYSAMGECYENVNDMQAAMNCYLECAEKYPEDGRIAETIADQYWKSYTETYHFADLKNVMEYSDRAQKNRKNAGPLLYRCFVLLHSNQFDNIQDVLETLKAERPYDWLVWQYYGVYYVRTGQYAEAMEHFTKSLETMTDENSDEENKIYSYYYLADCYEGLQEYPKAIEVLTQIKEINGGQDNSDINNRIGELYEFQEMYGDAEDSFNEGEKNAEYYRVMVNLYYREGRKMKVSSLISKAQLFLPKDQTADMFNNIGVYYEELANNYKKAIEFYKKALGFVKSKDAEKCFQLEVDIALCYYRLNNKQSAKEFAEQARETVRNAFDFCTEEEYMMFGTSVLRNMMRFSKMYFCLGDKNKALELLTRAEGQPLCWHCTYGKCYEIALNRAIFLEADGDYEDAMDMYHEAERLNLNDLEVKASIARMIERFRKG